jgi:HPr kinase/phosphorylase
VETQAHGALIHVLDVGVLIVGPSGVGKSECALELVSRGHKLVADDVVRIRRVESPEHSSAALVGTSPEMIRHYVEIRGIGLLYIPDLYGESSVRVESPVELLVHFEPWQQGGDYERIGLERERETLAGVAIPSLVLPVRPAGNMATLVEVAVRDHLQRAAGSNAARRLDDRLRTEHARQ